MTSPKNVIKGVVVISRLQITGSSMLILQFCEKLLCTSRSLYMFYDYSYHQSGKWAIFRSNLAGKNEVGRISLRLRQFAEIFFKSTSH